MKKAGVFKIVVERTGSLIEKQPKADKVFCTKCKKEKSRKDFPPAWLRKKGTTGTCRDCRATYRKVYRQTPKQKAKAAAYYDSRKNTPEYKALIRASRKKLEADPEWKARALARRRRWASLPDVLTRIKAKRRAPETKAQLRDCRIKARLFEEETLGNHCSTCGGTRENLSPYTKRALSPFGIHHRNGDNFLLKEDYGIRQRYLKEHGPEAYKKRYKLLCAVCHKEEHRLAIRKVSSLTLEKEKAVMTARIAELEAQLASRQSIPPWIGVSSELRT